MSSTWQQLRTVAMLGTDRAQERVQADADLGRVFRAVEARADGGSPDERAAVLLDQIAAATCYLRAGERLQRPEAGVGAPQPDLRPPMTQRGQVQLSRVLKPAYAALLPEWLEAASNAGFRPPPRALPALLEAGRQHPDIRPRLLPLIGPAGRWLAGKNPAWAYVEQAPQLDEAPEPGWLARAPHAERVEALRRWRRVAPTVARAWLENALSRERARERADLLGTLETSLAPEDESLLEGRLDDRAKDVRALAARLLGRLPTSALVDRMQARVAGHVVWCVNADGTRDLAVELPRKLEETARRDGIVEQPPHRTGKQEWWLRQMIAVVPPSRWSERWRAGPGDIVRAALRTDWADALLGGWAEATAAHKDESWAGALLSERVRHAPNLWSCLPVERAEPLLGRGLRRAAETGDLVQALMEVPRLRGPWSERFSRAVATSVRAAVERDLQISHRDMKDILGVCTLRMAPAASEAIQDILVRSLGGSIWTEAFHELVELLSFRMAVRREFGAADSLFGAP